MKENEIGTKIIASAIMVHRKLGSGLLENIYEIILSYELKKQGFNVTRQKPIPISYDGMVFNEAYKADIIVDDKVLIELKSVELIKPVHKKQLLTYLKLTKYKLGYLINFNEILLKNGITRIVNNL